MKRRLVSIWMNVCQGEWHEWDQTVSNVGPSCRWSKRQLETVIAWWSTLCVHVRPPDKWTSLIFGAFDLYGERNLICGFEWACKAWHVILHSPVVDNSFLNFLFFLKWNCLICFSCYCSFSWVLSSAWCPCTCTLLLLKCL